MRLHIADISVHLSTDDNLLARRWATLFARWPGLEAYDPLAPGYADSHPDAVLHLKLVEHLPPPPDSAPLFVNSAGSLPDNIGTLSVYTTAENEVLLYFRETAAIWIGLDQPQPRFHGVVTQQMFDYGRLEDVTFTSLAPLLRRRGYYLIHAFAAVYNGRAVLITGPSGSGKTTSGLRLITSGWGFLANDTVLLKKQSGGIYAWPMPGSISIKPGSLELLPWLMASGASELQNSPFHQEEGAIRKLIRAWSQPAPVTRIYFPKIETHPYCQIEPVGQSVCLAHLMEQSIDRWDLATLSAHINLLQEISHQAPACNLYLGQDLTQLPNLLTPTNGPPTNGPPTNGPPTNGPPTNGPPTRLSPASGTSRLPT